MHNNKGSKKAGWIKNFAVSIFVIAFFVSIILAYYSMLVNEKRERIIQNGEIAAKLAETQFNEYLATSIDAIELTAYTVDGMLAEDRSGDEILSYLVWQSNAVINTIFENTMGVYGCIGGAYYDGGGWVPEPGYEPKTRPWYTKAVANHGEVTLIDPYVDAQSGVVMMSLAKMLGDNESVISMDIYLDGIQEITESAVSSGATDMEMILDSRGMVIAHSDRGEVGKNYGAEQGGFAAEVFEHLGTGEEDFFEFFYNGSHYIAYQSRILNDWRCLSVQDATGVFQPLQRLLGVTVIIVALVVFVLSAFMSSYNKNTQAIESLTEEATLDKLTGFLNKAGTAAKMPELCQREDGMLAVLDLDNFKLVNDLYGHDMGDRVLSAFASIVRRNTRSGDVLCRIGGDEFLIFCKGVTDGSFVAGLANRLNSQFTAECARLMGADFGIPIGVSVGAVPVPEEGRDYQRLFPLADRALYHVKQGGKHSYAVYNGVDARMDGAAAETPAGELARVTQILEERGDAGDALWLAQDNFTSVYRSTLRLLRHSSGSAVKLLFLLSAAEGGDEAALSEASERFGETLRGTLDAQDVIFRSKPSQFFVLLPQQESAAPLVERVLDAWQKSPHHARCTVAYAAEELRFPDA